MSVRTVDLRYMGTDYRIAEPLREQGAEIRPAGNTTECSIRTCTRRFRAQTKVCRVMRANGIDPDFTLCLPCAIEWGALDPLEPVDEGQPTELAEQRAGVGR